MTTVYDWISLVIFSGLVVLFLQRSTQDKLVDSVWHYLPPAAGCALGNWLGNEGYALGAILVLIASMAYIFYVLKPTLPRR